MQQSNFSSTDATTTEPTRETKQALTLQIVSWKKVREIKVDIFSSRCPVFPASPERHEWRNVCCLGTIFTRGKYVITETLNACKTTYIRTSDFPLQATIKSYPQ